MDEIMTFALENGLWAALFCFLFFYMLKDSRNREKKYTSTITSLSNQISALTQSLEICQELKEETRRGIDITRTIKKDTELIKEHTLKLRLKKELL
ncbi:MAG: hypothetical protein IKC35_01645 [Clostridia bacterium]|nr:hypothetical protein [Clostridia bacterium]